MATKKPKNDAGAGDAPDVPSTVVVDSHYAFYDDEGNLFQWSEGQEVSDPVHVAMLVERDAPFTAKE